MKRIRLRQGSGGRRRHPGARARATWPEVGRCCSVPLREHHYLGFRESCGCRPRHVAAPGECWLVALCTASRTTWRSRDSAGPALARPSVALPAHGPLVRVREIPPAVVPMGRPNVHFPLDPTHLARQRNR